MCKSAQNKDFKAFIKALKTFKKFKFRGRNELLNSYAEIKDCVLTLNNFQTDPFEERFSIKFMSEILGCFNGAYKIDDLIKMFECGSNISLNRIASSCGSDFKCIADGFEFVIHGVSCCDDAPLNNNKELIYSSCISIDDFNFVSKAVDKDSLKKDSLKKELLCVCLSNNAYVACDRHRLHLYGFTTLKLDNSAPEPCPCFIPPDIIKLVNSVTPKNGIINIMWNEGQARISTGQFLIEYEFDKKMRFVDFSKVIHPTNSKYEYDVNSEIMINALKRIDVPKTCQVRCEFKNDIAVFSSAVKDSIQQVECKINTQENEVLFFVNKFFLIDGLDGFVNPTLWARDCDTPIVLRENSIPRISVVMPMNP